MSCEEARNMLDAYIDGELSAGQERALMDHVNACEACSQEFKAATLLKDVLSDMDEEVAVPLEAQAAWRNAVRQEAKKRSMRKLTRWVAAAAAALVLVVGCTFALRDGAPEENRIAEKGVVLVAKDGGEAQLAQAFAKDENDSVRKKYEAEDFDSACMTIEQLTAEYSGSFTAERGDEGETIVYRIELPRDYMEDFLAAASRIGAELDSQTMDLGGETAVIRIQIDGK